jgi:peptide/nickel transport system ATP-binding protein
MNTPVLEVQGLTVDVTTATGRVRVIEDIDLEVHPRQTLGLVGESGSGKSMTAYAIMRLLAPGARIVEGDIRVDGRSIVGLDERGMRAVRSRELGMVFQEPMTALDPAYSVGSQIAEAVRSAMGSRRRAAWERAVEMLDRVGIPDAERRAHDYPHNFSGGMRQRVIIAMALARSPKVLIADEPTTALDVTVQQQILDLLHDLRDAHGLGVLFISHDMGVIADVCDRVGVMYAGQIVEEAPVDDLFARPRHPYTRALLESMPRGPGSDLRAIPGSVPGLGEMPLGCRFAARCRYASPECDDHPIPLVRLPGRQVRCIAVDRIAAGQLEDA